MTATVFYATRSGNTRLVAEAIAEGLRDRLTVTVHPVEAGPDPLLTDEVELVVVGGPTEGHGMTEPMIAFLDGLPADALAGRAAAAFDTRVDWPRWLSGSAASGIRARLERAGARSPIASESFIVSMKPEVGPEELDRARRWGAALAESVARQPTEPRRTVEVGPLMGERS